MELRKNAYEEALSQLRMHAPLFWQRNNFFLLVQTGLFTYCVNVQYSEKEMSVLFSLLLYIMGFVTALIWYFVVKSGQKIQRDWRRIAIHFEKEYFEKTKEGPLTYADKYLQEGRNPKISISQKMIYFTYFFITVWIILFGKLFYDLLFIKG